MIVIQGSRRELWDEPVRSDRFRVAGDCAAVAEQAARGAAG